MTLARIRAGALAVAAALTITPLLAADADAIARPAAGKAHAGISTSPGKAHAGVSTSPGSAATAVANSSKDDKGSGGQASDKECQQRAAIMTEMLVVAYEAAEDNDIENVDRAMTAFDKAKDAGEKRGCEFVVHQ